MSQSEGAELFVQRVGRILKYCLINLVIIVIVLEISLQLISLVIKEERSNTSVLRHDLSILVLGDSNTFGLYVTADQSWPSQLEKIVNQNEARATVYNYGYPGNSSTRIAENLQEMVTLTQPDLVIILAGVNDAWNYPVNYALNENTAGPLSRLLEKSRVIRFFKILIRSNLETHIEGERHFDFVDKTPIEKQEYMRENMSQQDTEVTQGQDITLNDKNWKLGVQLIEDEERPFTRSKKNIDQNYIATMNDIRNFLHEKRIPMVTLNYASNLSKYKGANARINMLTDNFVIYDLTEKFQRSCDNEICDNLLFEDQHPNVNGHRLYAELVYEALLEHAETKVLFNN